jgi:hypothetical protein
MEKRKSVRDAMAEMKDCMKTMHDTAATNWAALGKCLSAKASEIDKASTSGGDYGDIHGFLTTLASQCCDASEAHILGSKSLDSINYGSSVTAATDADDLSKIAPDFVRGIIPSDVPADGFGVTPVPRFGQSPMGIDTRGIDPRFSKLVEIDTGE